MKRYCAIVLFLLSLFPLFAQLNVKADAYYRLWGAVELRTAVDFSQDALAYTTLNHEGGLPVKVLEIGKSDAYGGESGAWVYVMTTSWVWAQDETRVPQYAKFWVFLCDDDVVQAVR